ncbi:hypothetical protein J1605_009211 [Eschrichtius robustus]|uniref:Uncharacterized protein n=1 Tax=Eschrichtius robustus TaxID=9764 RepID=A0AB34GSS2_ESCRO|nr:hypothetical protein J1605_009211 [Eschrichtius robustus]
MNPPPFQTKTASLAVQRGARGPPSRAAGLRRLAARCRPADVRWWPWGWTDGPVSRAVTTGGALRPECRPLPPPALRPQTALDPGPWGLQRPLAPGSQGRAQRHHSVLVTPPPPEAPPRPRSRARQLRPLSLSPLDSSSLGPTRAAVYKHSLTGNLREKCLGFAHVPAWVWARNPGRELCHTPHSPPATFPAATVPRHSGPRRLSPSPCISALGTATELRHAEAGRRVQESYDSFITMVSTGPSCPPALAWTALPLLTWCLVSGDSTPPGAPAPNSSEVTGRPAPRGGGPSPHHQQPQEALSNPAWPPRLLRDPRARRPGHLASPPSGLPPLWSFEEPSGDCPQASAPDLGLRAMETLTPVRPIQCELGLSPGQARPGRAVTTRSRWADVDLRDVASEEVAAASSRRLDPAAQKAAPEASGEAWWRGRFLGLREQSGHQASTKPSPPARVWEGEEGAGAAAVTITAAASASPCLAPAGLPPHPPPCFQPATPLDTCGFAQYSGRADERLLGSSSFLSSVAGEEPSPRVRPRLSPAVCSFSQPLPRGSVSLLTGSVGGVAPGSLLDQGTCPATSHRAERKHGARRSHVQGLQAPPRSQASTKALAVSGRASG